MRIRSPFRYPGSKNRLSICELILSFFPENIHEYREPFVGSGGIYFAQNKYEKRWINDIDEQLISVYKILLEKPNDFIKICREIPCPIENKKNPKIIEILKFKFEELLNDDNTPLRYFFLNRTCWGGRVRKNLTYFTYPDGWNITRKNGYLERIAKYLEKTKITSQNYSQMIHEPGNNVFLYIDPPYMNDTERPESSKFYDNSFDYKDHEKLANDLKKCKHKWCLSYDNNEYIKKLYENFKIKELSWTYNVATKTRKKGKEIIIKNY